MVGMNDVRGVLPAKLIKFMHQLRVFIRTQTHGPLSQKHSVPLVSCSWLG